MTTIDVQLRAEWVRNVGYRYDVLLDGETIVRRSRDPEFDTARALHARDLRGRFRTIDFVTGKHRMTLDIEKAAKLRTIEGRDAGPTIGAFQPMSDEDKTRLFANRSRQGRVIRAEGVQSTGDGEESAGGETAVASRRVPEDA